MTTVVSTVENLPTFEMECAATDSPRRLDQSSKAQHGAQTLPYKFCPASTKSVSKTEMLHTDNDVTTLAGNDKLVLKSLAVIEEETLLGSPQAAATLCKDDLAVHDGQACFLTSVLKPVSPDAQLDLCAALTDPWTQRRYSRRMSHHGHVSELLLPDCVANVQVLAVNPKADVEMVGVLPVIQE